MESKVKREPEAPKTRQREPYQKPELKEVGRIQNVTQSGSGMLTDVGGLGSQ